MGAEHVRRGRNNKLRGKLNERRVAKLVGGKRNPDNGSQIFDVQTLHAGYEVKSYQRPTPGWIVRAWEQALAGEAQTGLEPHTIHVYHEANGRLRYWEITEVTP